MFYKDFPRAAICNEGFIDNKHCCCRCTQLQKSVHPILGDIGYVCILFRKERIYHVNSKHGMCEAFEEKK